MISACGGGGGGGTNPGSADQPTVSIAAPTGTYFKEGENIVFSGSATDSGGGQLTGSALAWSSNIDGQIGTGETLITSVLSPGNHNIALRATDAAGAAASVTLPAITVARTRFIKMGLSTTGVPDASSAFDGDENTAATIAATDTEFICFKAYLGGADTFIFKMKLGASTSGSNLVLQGLSTSGVWQPAGEYGLNADQTVMVTIGNAQDYLDAEGYINLRVLWESGAAGDNAPVYEIWRVDPPYAGSQTTGVDNPALAFDGDPSTAATILQPYSGGGSILHFKAYVGTTIAGNFTFTIRHNNIGNSQLLSYDVENMATAAWENIDSLILNTTAARTVSIPITSDLLDTDGYISLRLRWVNGALTTPPGVNVYEIQRVDSFYLDPRTSFGLIQDPENAVDQDRDTYAIMHNYWGENDHYDTLNAVIYLGDATAFTFSMKTAQSMSGYTSELIVEGENSPDAWSEIQRIPLTQDTPGTDVIDLPDARQFVNADGWLSLRVRWEDHSAVLEPLVNGYIYEIWPGID
jgi:hypothetical protein